MTYALLSATNEVNEARVVLEIKRLEMELSAKLIKLNLKSINHLSVKIQSIQKTIDSLTRLEDQQEKERKTQELSMYLEAQGLQEKISKAKKGKLIEIDVLKQEFEQRLSELKIKNADKLLKSIREREDIIQALEGEEEAIEQENQEALPQLRGHFKPQ